MIISKSMDEKFYKNRLDQKKIVVILITGHD